MPCGCTKDNLDNKKLELDSNYLDNKSHDLILDLDNMKNMSIDEIINLYRQGYRLEYTEAEIYQEQNMHSSSSENSSEIKSLMVAVPSIVDATGFWYSSPQLGCKGYIAVLFSNPGTCGWMKLVAGDDQYWPSGVFDTKEQCFSSKTGLLYKALHCFANPINIGFVEYYGCNTTSNDTCHQAGCTPGATPSCTNVPSSPTSNRHSISIPPYDPTVPNPPTNLQVVAGDRQLTFSWTKSTYVDPVGGGVFDYYLELSGPDGIPPARTGHVTANTTSYLFENLVNGSDYRLDIRAVSRSDMQSSIVSKTGRPTGPITGTIHFAVTTSDSGPKDGFDIYLDGSSTRAGTTNASGTFDIVVTGSPSPGTSHTYRIHKTNYTDQIGNVSVISGQISNVSKIMQAILILTSIAPQSPVTLLINTTQQFTALDQNNNPITGASWTKVTGVGSIDPVTGLYTAGGTADSAQISATYQGVTKTVDITVSTTVSVLDHVSLSSTSATIPPGETKSIFAYPKDDSNNTIVATVTWSSSDITTAAISPTTGPTTTVTAGPTEGKTATITASATAGGITKTATVAITVSSTPVGEGGGAGMIFGLLGIAVLGMMMISKKSPEKS